ncbi:MAG: aminotransferase class I/II-fold pyridoxal phosphate-dependent enzyme, partial [Proteobacteria bacterium]|nr:aminotransferase class I/II-fold pyridoxal phosphate-dependent enzyme [Pseudomonadota bacterium]
LGEKLGLKADSFFIGNGSNEVIEQLINVFGVGGEVVYPEPSFAVYPIAVKAHGAKGVSVPLKDGFKIDLEAIAKSITTDTRLVFIANPNNPTGTMVGAKEFDAFMEQVPDSVIVCMDEAYAEYVTSDDYPDTLKYVKEGRRIIGLRTFSKIYGLAGLRVGYGFAPAEIIGYLERVRQPFNVNSLALAAALGAIDDDEHVHMSREVNAAGLEYLYSELDRLKVEYVPTQANFFLIKVGDGKGVYGGLLKLGVIVRPMASYGLGEYIRVTVGLVEENERFIEALAVVLG